MRYLFTAYQISLHPPWLALTVAGATALAFTIQVLTRLPLPRTFRSRPGRVDHRLHEAAPHIVSTSSTSHSLCTTRAAKYQLSALLSQTLKPFRSNLSQQPLRKSTGRSHASTEREDLRGSKWLAVKLMCAIVTRSLLLIASFCR